jgi:hypothetical protein
MMDGPARRTGPHDERAHTTNGQAPAGACPFVVRGGDQPAYGLAPLISTVNSLPFGAL